jgi:endoribonuclease LACTB2
MAEKLVELAKVAVLSPRVTRILGCNPGKFTLQGTNTYLIGTGPKRILLDTGDGRPEYKKLLNQYLKVTGIEISVVLISHWHIDHTGGVEDVLATCNAARTYKFPRPEVDAFPDSVAVEEIRDGQVFSIGDTTLECIYTPGHADDHLVFYLREENSLFSADNILGQGTTVFSDLKLYLESLHKMKSLGAQRIYPGHGPLIESATDKINEYITHRQEREDQIVALLSKNGSLSLDGITGIIYEGYPANILDAAARSISLHLNKLRDDKKIIENEEGKWVLTTGHKL